jgi:hypothetical protein
MAVVGSPGTLNVTYSIACFFNCSRCSLTRSAVRPVTTKAHLPISDAKGAASWIVPEPKIMRVAVENSNLITARV